ncbi:unnamed protein product [Enterobius vermicularis]|uniref:Myotubularin phosphatase domain-containing protein n=1 Tax=Enterobius vermicularis TaxID=51028 RepID=A0A0N4VLQ5_ENTVE|nr:unnamed protein product [Enterobius vermicularis]
MYAECSWSDTDASPFFNYHLRSSNSSPENLSAIRISGFRAALDPLYGYPSVVVSACERDAVECIQMLCRLPGILKRRFVLLKK